MASELLASTMNSNCAGMMLNVVGIFLVSLIALHLTPKFL